MINVEMRAIASLYFLDSARQQQAFRPVPQKLNFPAFFSPATGFPACSTVNFPAFFSPATGFPACATKSEFSGIFLTSNRLSGLCHKK
ncbi:MAG: hypothetical protein WCD53_11855 [Microcoleus sp.]